jgi:hypothetical protein
MAERIEPRDRVARLRLPLTYRSRHKRRIGSVVLQAGATAIVA